jgi:transposase
LYGHEGNPVLVTVRVRKAKLVAQGCPPCRTPAIRTDGAADTRRDAVVCFHEPAPKIVPMLRK